MGDNARTHGVRRRHTRQVRVVVDAAMALVYLLQMAPYQTGGWYHELAGIAFVVLLVAHHVLNARWIAAELRRRDWLPLVLDVLLLACVVGIAVTGILMARHVRLVRLEGMAHVVRPLHACLTYAGLMLVSVHAGMHLPARGLDRLVPAARAAVVAVVVALGCHAFVTLNVYGKLSLGLSFPDGTTPLPVLVVRHAMLAGPFVLLGMAVTQLRKRGERT